MISFDGTFRILFDPAPQVDWMLAQLFYFFHLQAIWLPAAEQTVRDGGPR
jgi:hypothetical protein